MAVSEVFKIDKRATYNVFHAQIRKRGTGEVMADLPLYVHRDKKYTNQSYAHLWVIFQDDNAWWAFPTSSWKKTNGPGILNFIGEYAIGSNVEIRYNFNDGSNRKVTLRVPYDGACYTITKEGEAQPITPSENPEPQYDLMYDVEDGNLKIYENGDYQLTGSEATGNLIGGIAENATFSLYMRQKTYKFDYTEEVEVDGETVQRKYAMIPAIDFPFPGEYKVYVNYGNGASMTKHATMFVFDSGIDISFNRDSITIDRSEEGGFERQLPNGTNLLDYITVTQSGETVMQYDVKYLHFYIGTYSSGSGTYRGNAVSLSNREFDRCTWVSGASDDIWVSYGSKVYDSMTVTITESDPNSICIRGAEIVSRNFVAGNTYKISDFIKFIPEDSNFEYFELNNFSLTSKNSDYLQIRKNDSTPSTWAEFYNGYMTINALKGGRTRVYYTWKSDSSSTGGGGDFEVTIKSS